MVVPNLIKPNFHYSDKMRLVGDISPRTCWRQGANLLRTSC